MSLSDWKAKVNISPILFRSSFLPVKHALAQRNLVFLVEIDFYYCYKDRVLIYLDKPLSCNIPFCNNNKQQPEKE